MPLYQFTCENKKCQKSYETLTKYDETGEYAKVLCPYCHSADKKKEMNQFAFNFTDPVGTDKWNNSHDYRFNHNLPKVKSERENAAKKARQTSGLTSANPYGKIDDISSGKHFGEVK